MKFLKNNIIFILLIGAIIIAGYLFLQRQPSKEVPKSNALWENYEIKEMTIEGKKMRLIVADTPARWEKGLMFVRKPVTNFDGMIFIFPNSEYHTFWNLNTFEDLTLYWMKDDIITSKSPLPSIEKSKEIVRVSSTEPVNIVVELIE